VGKYAIAAGVILSALAFLGFLAYTNLERYTGPRYYPPSQEARANRFLALDRWLRQQGRLFRVESSGDPALILKAPEGLVFVQASLFSWPADAWEQLEPWISGGGALIVSLDDMREYLDYDEKEYAGLREFLSGLGILHQTDSSGDYGEMGETEPNLDRRFSFSLRKGLPPESGKTAPGGIASLKDQMGVIRLVRVSRGAGSVTVLGEPYFLHWNDINREPNARLAWNLFSRPGAEGGGILFIRGQRLVKSLFGRLADRGNTGPLLLSALALVAVGLWTVLPLFGVLAREEGKPGRPLQERFLAEGRFFRKYRALGTYRAAFIREIERRLRRREGLVDQAALDRRIGELWNEAAPPGRGSHEGPLPRRERGGRSFVQTINTLETILERIKL
jgi:hypothetical protein